MRLVAAAEETPRAGREAGLAPVQSQSRRTRCSRGATYGDKALRRVFYRSALCAVQHDPVSRTY
ncbi:transposase [Streptomyces sp. NPDC059629]|uniref:transposase n=1 Tax=Streptomyces sp. NPDC059629 TaxID=3346889 RepID=UPI00368E15CF